MEIYTAENIFGYERDGKLTKFSLVKGANKEMPQSEGQRD